MVFFARFPVFVLIFCGLCFDASYASQAGSEKAGTCQVVKPCETPVGIDTAAWTKIQAQLRESAMAFQMVTKLTALADGATGDQFGYSVSVAGDVTLVGALWNEFKGATYVFERDAGGANAWGQIMKLTAASGAASFGSSVSMAGDVALVGTFGSGAAYVFEKFSELSSADMYVLGTNGAVIADSEVASVAKGTDFGGLTIDLAVTNGLAITNAGTTVLTISGITAHGAGAAQFSVLDMPSTVEGGTVSNFSLIFQPTVSGVPTAVVEIANNSTSTPYCFYLAGIGLKRDQTIASR